MLFTSTLHFHFSDTDWPWSDHKTFSSELWTKPICFHDPPSPTPRLFSHLSSMVDFLLFPLLKSYFLPLSFQVCYTLPPCLFNCCLAPIPPSHIILCFLADSLVIAINTEGYRIPPENSSVWLMQSQGYMPYVEGLCIYKDQYVVWLWGVEMDRQQCWRI